MNDKNINNSNSNSDNINNFMNDYINLSLKVLNISNKANN